METFAKKKQAINQKLFQYAILTSIYASIFDLMKNNMFSTGNCLQRTMQPMQMHRQRESHKWRRWK